ncbi:hypothetical protein LEP1GSC047_0938 [Leptospira inadai serovar Lyme str. 10]|uniref:Uncharacterized protein n=2 Tax=Leptospira inadai serovar Lyme TaxID=293084 RepID=V6HA66_9LEPT|nr:hypothetical protein [Leptospira inadai]EQA36231.1 hypothetical protein LEP1GSC047_0938 [Leptospira inadai serovar Lyme str. 10]PNV71391.1 hypothetical protein BES34_021590 [Leptospira inadai serovar Lyme]
MKKYTILFLLLSVILCKEKSVEQVGEESKKEINMPTKANSNIEDKKLSRFNPPSGIYSMVDSTTMATFLSADIPDAREYCLEINLESSVAIAKFRKNSNKYKIEIESLRENGFSLLYKGKRRELEFQQVTFRGITGYDLYCAGYSHKNKKGEWNPGSECGRLQSFQSLEECEAHFEKYIKEFGDVKSEETM